MATPAERIKEAAERDEAAAETEREQPGELEPDEEGEAEGDEAPAEPATEPTTLPPPADEAALAKAFEKLDREAERHAKRVAEIMGDDFAHLELCPRCDIQGFIWPAGSVELEPEKVAAVKVSIGDEPAPDYRRAPDADPCDTCAALGQVLTGSRAPGHTTKVCADCSGTGWRAKARLTPAPTFAGEGQNSSGPGEMSGTVEVGADAWGRPAGHPHWGVPPASIGS